MQIGSLNSASNQLSPMLGRKYFRRLVNLEAKATELLKCLKY